MKKLLLLCLMFFAVNATAATKIILNNQNTISLLDYVYDESVNNIIIDAQRLDTQFPHAGPIYLVLHTGGGSIVDGLDLIHALKGLKRPVHTIVLHAYSMGFVITQHLGTRYIVEQGALMQHNARGAFYGEFPGNAVTRMKFWLKKLKHMMQATSDRTGIPVKTLMKKFDNEYWCTGSDCISEKFADEIAAPTCDASLAGTHNKVEEIPLGLMGSGDLLKLVITSTHSNCPLAPSPSKTIWSTSSQLGFGEKLSDLGVDAKKVLQQSLQIVKDRKTPVPRGWFEGDPVENLK
jgi:ATP-dependent protease ClpP protease subunit